MNLNRNLLLPGLLLLTLSGCAILPGGGVDVDMLRQQGIESVADERDYEFGHGVGNTEQEAMEAAQQELGQTVFIQVHTEINNIRRTTLSEEGINRNFSSSSQLDITSRSFSDVELAGRKVDARQRGRDGWYVRVRMTREEVQKLRQEIQRRAPLIAYLELLQDTDTTYPGRRFKHAIRGLAEAERLSLTDQRIMGQSYGGVSYAAFFKQQLAAAMSQMQVLPLYENNRVRLALIDRQTYAPISGVWLQAGDRHLVTDSKGLTEPFSIPQTHRKVREVVNQEEPAGVASRLLSRLSGSNNEPQVVERTVLSEAAYFDVLALGDHDSLTQTALGKEELLLLRVTTETLKKPTSTLVYVHSIPDKALISLGNDERSTPALFEVPSSQDLTFQVYETTEFRGRRLSVKTSGRGYIYISETLVERHYGQLELAFNRPGDDYAMTLFDRQGQVVGSGSQLNQPVEVGSYTLQLHNTKDSDAYQSLIDESIRVHRDQVFSRHYARPVYRERWIKGLLAQLDVSFGNRPGDKYMIPTAGSKTTFATLEGAEDCGGTCSGLKFDYKNEFSLSFKTLHLADRMSLAYGGSLGLRNIMFKVDQHDDQYLFGFTGSLGAGFWTSRIGSASWITANYGFNRLEWSDRDGVLKKTGIERSVTNAYPFLEMGINFFEGVTLGLRVPDPAYGSPELFIGFGALELESGYHLSEQLDAKAGIHY